MRITIAFSICIVAFAMNVQAQQRHSSRATGVDVYIGPQYIASQTVDFRNSAKAEINSRAALLFGVGYNFNQHLALGASFSASSGNYTGTSVNETGKSSSFVSNLYSSTFNLEATYNILPGNFTPFVTGNFGFTYLDSGINNGSVSQGCWWDPWWGYQCSPYANTYTDTRLNYGGMAGLRYDFPNNVYVKGGVGVNYLDLSKADNAGFTYYNLIIGYTFD